MSNGSSNTVSMQPKDVIKSAAPWTAARAVVAVVLSFFLSQTIGSILLTAYPQLMGWSENRADAWLADSIGAQFTYVVITEMLTILILWLFWRAYKKAVVLKALGLHRRLNWRDIGFAAIGAMAYFALYFIILISVNAILPVDTSQEQAVGFDHATGGALLLAFISLVILPPIVEEIMFRGFLFSGLKRRFGITIAIVFTSILFAAPHLLTGKEGLLWVAAIDTFSLSIVLCYLREITGALYAPILVHAIKNSIAFVALFLLHAV